MPKGLAIVIGSGKPKGEPEHDAEESGEEDAFAKEAFAAIKDDDEAGFISAFKSAVEACVAKSNGGEYESEPED